MAYQDITIKLSDALYESAQRIAHATKRPLADVVQESLVNTLPPLNDIPDDEVEAFARMSSLDDAALWRVGDVEMSEDEQRDLNELLYEQNERPLNAEEQVRLQTLMNQYGHLMVQKSHAWLLLARRGYQVPPQKGNL